MDINNVTSTALITGNLFYGGAAEADYYVEGTSAVYATGIWVGGKVDGEILTAGATYSDFEFWPGPLASNGRPVNPNNCAEYDRIWKVSIEDIRDFEQTGNAARDLRDWPALLGAPVLAGFDNGFDDDGDGIVDEGTNGIDDDLDGQIDEADERETVNIQRRLDNGLSPYDLAAGDRPDIVLDQSLWWIMNDVGNVHSNTGSNPLGIEVQVQVFAVNESGPLGNTTFYRYKVINKSGRDITDSYLTVFSDPDLGAAGDDFVGSNVDLSLGYVYNADNFDEGGGFGPGYGFGVPAVGYDFFQGPILDRDIPGVGDNVAPDTLGLTGFNYFINGGPAALTDPGNAEEMYNIMSGLSTTGEPITDAGIGVGAGGNPTSYAFSGNPLTGQGWTEISAGNTPGDRRFTVTTGPFVLGDGDVQDIVFGIIWSRVIDTRDSPNEPAIRSVAKLFIDDLIAQQAYDDNFDIKRAPPAPPLCERNASNPALQLNSGSCFEATANNGEIVLTWGYPEESSNFNGSYSRSGVRFEGFNVYQYSTSSFAANERRLIASYDKDNNLEIFTDDVQDPDLLILLPEVQLVTDNTGLQYYHVVQGEIIDNRDYFFGVSAFGYDAGASPQRYFESPPTNITVRPTFQSGITQGGIITPGELINPNVFARSPLQVGTQNLVARVVDPEAVRAGTYEVEIVDSGDGNGTPTYVLRRNGEVVFDGAAVFARTRRVPALTDNIVVDGLALFDAELGIPEDDVDIQPLNTVVDGDTTSYFFDLAGSTLVSENPNVYEGGAGVVEVESPNGDPCVANGRPVNDVGCALYGGNTVFLDTDASNSYFVAATENLDGDGRDFARDLRLTGSDDYEIRFTEACADSATPCYGLYNFTVSGGARQVVRVPFEIYQIGKSEGDGIVGNPADDVRLIPVIRQSSGSPLFENWSDSFVGVEEDDLAGTPFAEADSVVVSDRIFAYFPDTPGPDGNQGYEAFAAAAAASGIGNLFVDTSTPDDAAECLATQDGFFIDFCYRRNRLPLFNNRPFVLQNVTFGSLDLASPSPDPGTTVRFNFIEARPEFSIGDRFTLDTTPLAPVLGQQDVAENALDFIGVVPNPYRAQSQYERTTNDRRVRFVGLPEQAVIRIYTVSGTLIKTIQKAGPDTTIDWNLETENNLPVASGMYLVHVEARTADGSSIGEKVLKLGVIQRKTSINIF